MAIASFVESKYIPLPISVAAAIGLYKAIIDGLLSTSSDQRLVNDNRIFDARCRIAKDLGILDERDMRREHTLEEDYRFDYAKEDQEISEE